MRRMRREIAAVATALLLSTAACAAPADCPAPDEKDPAIAAFVADATVRQRIADMKGQGWTEGGYYMVNTAMSCGVVGCVSTYLVGRYMNQGKGQVNPQMTSVQASVQMIRASGKVLSVDLVNGG